jgi:integrase
MKGCKVLNQEEIDSLLAAAKNQKERMLVLVGLYFGTRISESLSLTFGDFKNTDHVRIQRMKGSNESVLRIPRNLWSEIRALRKEYERQGYTVTSKTPLFKSRKGVDKPLNPTSAMNVLQDMFKRAGIRGKVGAHSFRKCFTTKIYELCGKDPVQTAVYTGHKSIDSLISYIETTHDTSLTTELSWSR